MNPTDVPRKVTEKTMQRRGVLHPLADLDPGVTALLVIDMQDYFIEMVPAARSVVGNVNRLAAGVRRAGAKVVWIQMTVAPEDRQKWSHFYAKLLSERERDAHFDELHRGAKEWQLWHELDVADDDWIVEKNRFSAFIQGSSGLEARLRDAGIRTLLITGTVTNVCCESTARDAMMLDFESIIVSDGCAALDDEAHLSTLCNFQSLFGDVLSTDEVLASIDRTVQLKRA
jgi:ureidoacrylate peracid hydrolase